MRQYDAIEKQIIKILKTIPKESSRLKWSGARPWTRQIKNKICKLGKKIDIVMSAPQGITQTGKNGSMM